MLGIFLIICSGLLIWFSVQLLDKILEFKKHLVNLVDVFKNFFFVFCIILSINLLSWSIFGNFSKNSINQEIINLVFNFAM
jgi:hypothetical protein